MYFVPVSDYLALPRAPEEYVIQDLLPAGGLLNIYGRPKTGKSFLAMQLAAAMANPASTEVLGYPLYSHGPVAYLQVDTARGTWAKRIHDNFLEAGIHMPNLHLADTGTAPYPFNILHEGRHWLKAACEELKPIAVVIDTIREIHRGDENDSAHLQAAVSALVEATAPAALIILSHSRKNKADDLSDDLMAENRGSNYLPGRADVILRVTSDTRIDYQGRSVDRTQLAVSRDSFGLFHAQDPVGPIVARVLEEMPPSRYSEKQQISVLQQHFPKMTFDQLRGQVRKHKTRLRREERPH